MNKIRTSGLMKFLAWVVIAVSGMALVASGFLAIGMHQSGFYTRSFEDIREEYYERYSDRYSAMVLDHLDREDEYNKKYFADKNFRYGVIQADSYTDLERMDLNDPNNYVERNFEEEISIENVHIFQCALTDNTYFELHRPNSLGGYYWINNTGSYWNTYEIDRYVYDEVTGVFYCCADGLYYPIPYVLLKIFENDNYYEEYLAFDSENMGYQVAHINDYESYQTDAGDIKIDGTGVHSVVTDSFLSDTEYASVLEVAVFDANIEEYMSIIYQEPMFNFGLFEQLGENRGSLEDVVLSNRSILEPENGVWYGGMIELSYESFSENTIENRIVINQTTQIECDGFVRVMPNGEKSVNYFVLSFQPETLSTYGKDWVYSDLYVKFNHVFGTAYQARYQVFGVLFASVVLYVLAFVFLCTCAGYKKGENGLVERRINRIPIEIYGGVFVFLEMCAIVMLDGISYYISDVTEIFWMVVGSIVVLIAGLLLTGAMLEIVCRIKLGTLFKRTCVYWVVSRCWGCFIKIWNYSREHVSMIIRTILLFLGIFFAKFIAFALVNGGNGFGVLLWLLLDGIILVGGIWSVIQLQKLKEAGKSVAAGDLDYKVDTHHMYWDFKQHAEHLNNIGDGLAHAVDERMRSERFKTELITNVSHDIKTPLTSIINYVDLIQKEEIHNEKIEEYLEVLERQSKRLKKLLEDLLEASKASTGTLPVGFETLEAGVFMVQTVGEFEEKTLAHDLELIIKKPEEPVYINADGRHFWRVIDNLMNNICKYAQPNTRVYINLEATKEEVFITFRNTSHYPLNITSEELLERFVRGDESRHTEGSGLGLSIAQSLMELMHGRFELVVDGDLFKVILVFKRVDKAN